MSAPYIIPFNHQPVSTGVSTNYTVPSGKYARVVINLNASAACSQNDSLGTGFSGAPSASVNCQSDSKSNSIELWLKAGDNISFALQNAAGSAGFNSGFVGNTAAVLFDAAASESAAVAFHNGNEVASARAVAQASATVSGTFVMGTFTMTYATFTGDTRGRIYYEEYNVIS